MVVLCVTCYLVPIFHSIWEANMRICYPILILVTKAFDVFGCYGDRYMAPVFILWAVFSVLFWGVVGFIIGLLLSRVRKI